MYASILGVMLMVLGFHGVHSCERASTQANYGFPVGQAGDGGAATGPFPGICLFGLCKQGDAGTALVFDGGSVAQWLPNSGGGGGSAVFPAVATQLSSVITSGQISSMTYVAGFGPSITATTGTSAILFLSLATCNVNGTGGGDVFLSFAVSGATTIAASDNNAAITSADSTSSNNPVFRSILVTGLTPGSNTFAARYRVDSGNSFNISNVTMAVVIL